MDVGELISVIEGGLVFGSCAQTVRGFEISSTAVTEGACFVAIKGSKRDGNDYISEAINNGASVILSESEPNAEVVQLACRLKNCKRIVSYILCKNVHKAVIKAVTYFREKYIEKLVAVTGSVGKTTVKELIYSLLSRQIALSKTKGNLNNGLGLPLTILSSHNAKNIVCEAGISNIGEMEPLSEIAKPSVAVITNIGKSHTLGLGGRENTAKEKLKIISHAKSGCSVMINGDEPLLSESEYLKNAVEKTGINVVRVSAVNEKSDYYLFNVRDTERGAVFDLKKGGALYLKDVFVPIYSAIGAFDAALSIAVADKFGITEENIRKGLNSYLPCGDRQRLVEKNGYFLLLDCYNASPESFSASLNALEIIAREKGIEQRCIVAGSMLELGEITEKEHYALGERIGRIAPSLLITVGGEAETVGVAAVEGGMKIRDVVSVRYTFEGSCGEVEGLSGDVKALNREAKGSVREVKALDGEVKALDGEVKALNGEVKTPDSADVYRKIAAVIKERMPFGSIVLIKGSRALRLEKTLDHI